jgi:hypothetical protein
MMICLVASSAQNNMAARCRQTAARSRPDAPLDSWRKRSIAWVVRLLRGEIHTIELLLRAIETHTFFIPARNCITQLAMK